jgi:hypothetical protein
VSAQNLSARSVRRIERSIGEPVLRGWGHGGYVMGFVTPDHRHGWWDKKTGEVEWSANPMHYSSCWTTWPEQMPAIPSRPRPAANPPVTM